MTNNPVKHGTPCRDAFEKWLVEVKDLMFAQRGVWEAWEEAWRQASTMREAQHPVDRPTYSIGRDPASFGNVYRGNDLIVRNDGNGLPYALVELVEAANRSPKREISGWRQLDANAERNAPVLLWNQSQAHPVQMMFLDHPERGKGWYAYTGTSGWHVPYSAKGQWLYQPLPSTPDQPRRGSDNG